MRAGTKKNFRFGLAAFSTPSRGPRIFVTCPVDGKKIFARLPGGDFLC